MKKINVISVEFSEKTGIQYLYETIEECENEKGRDSDCLLFMDDKDVVGAVFAPDNGFIEVYNNYDEFEIIEEDENI